MSTHFPLKVGVFPYKVGLYLVTASSPIAVPALRSSIEYSKCVRRIIRRRGAVAARSKWRLAQICSTGRYLSADDCSDRSSFQFKCKITTVLLVNFVTMRLYKAADGRRESPHLTITSLIFSSL